MLLAEQVVPGDLGLVLVECHRRQVGPGYLSVK
jgi:hypothetical protein